MANEGTIVLAQTVVKSAVNMEGWSRQAIFAAQKAVYRLGQETRDMARGAAPVRTGALRASIYVTRPSSESAQASGTTSRQASAGYRRAAEKAARLNPLVDSGRNMGPYTSVRVVLDHGQKVLLLAAGNRRDVYIFLRDKKGRHGHLGTQEYDQISDDRMLSPMGAVSGDTFYVTVGAAAGYAAFVEYGTVHMRAQPFLTPAVNWARGELAGRLKEAIGDEKARMVVKG